MEAIHIACKIRKSRFWNISEKTAVLTAPLLFVGIEKNIDFSGLQTIEPFGLNAMV